MAETKNIDETVEKTENNPPQIFKLVTPIEFDGVSYKEIDLSGLDGLTGRDIRELDNLFRMKGGRIGVTVKEFDSLYLQLIASRVTKLPLEFFDKIGIRDATKLEVKIRNFLMMWG